MSITRQNEGLSNRMGWKRFSIASAILIGLAAPALAQNSIDTIPAWNGTQFISSFGVPDTATYGQTITVPPGASALNSYSFEIGFCSAAVTFRGEVFAFGTNVATGSALAETAPITVAAGNTFTLVQFNVGELNLTPGTYVLMATTSKDQTGAPNSSCRFGSVGNNTAYAGGQFVFINNGAVPAQWTSGTWSSIAQDLAFQVNGLNVTVVTPPVSTAPASSTTSLLIGFAALAALGVAKLSRQQQTS